LFSFLLINFWTIKTTSIKSANKALTYNQLSDAFFMVMIVGFYFQGVEICTSPGTAPTTPLALAALVVCVCCKSAQFPFHFWLPDSMEAPIPASALIHSATLVSAGVYLILRLSAYHSFSQFLTYPLTFLSLLTVVVGGVASCMQNDLKKVLAYSTIANCGFMVLFAALNKNSLCFLYFALHGVFKAATFFLVGTIVINSHHKQD
jgi:NADH-quinone oxidoreductase subunit L